MDHAIHPNDDMLRTAGMPKAWTDRATDYYFTIGSRALDLIGAAMSIAGASPPANILDLPCGYGRVMRHLRERFPSAKLHACELNREAVDFCAATFGAEPIYSTPEPKEVRLPAGMDLIWVGSLLTHLSEEDALNFLQAFDSALAPGGLLCFTLHGRHATRELHARAAAKPHVRYMVDDLSAKGWAFRARDGRYGGSYTAPSWIANNVVRAGWKLVLWSEASWGGQDFLAVQKVTP
jgi:SAM-dependent methyltransferase